MLHQNSVFHSVLKQVPWHRFDRLVDEHHADKHVRRLTTKGQLIALIYAQLSGAQSLREVEAALESHSAKLYHLGGEQVARATLSDANAQRPWQVFGGLFGHLVGQLTRGLKRKAGEAVHLIDATSLHLSALSKDWAQFSTGVCGAKMHVIYDPDADCPIYAAVTAADVNDITAAKAMPITAGATYVFDLGYYDYGWWAKLDAAGCLIVTRLKVNTKLKVVTENAVAKGSNILSDRIGHLPQRLARNRNNPFQDPVRELRVRSESGKILRILSNDLDLPAQQIADLYKRRWQIGVSSQRARCHVGESPTEAKRLRLRSKGGAVARKQDGGALRQHAREECARSIRLQRTVNADVASLHVLYQVAETVDNARRQQGPTKGSEAAVLTGGVSAVT